MTKDLIKLLIIEYQAYVTGLASESLPAAVY